MIVWIAIKVAEKKSENPLWLLFYSDQGPLSYIDVIDQEYNIELEVEEEEEV